MQVQDTHRYPMSRTHLEALAHRSLTADVGELRHDLAATGLRTSQTTLLEQQLATVEAEISSLHSQDRLLPAWLILDDRINLINDAIRALSQHPQHAQP